MIFKPQKLVLILIGTFEHRTMELDLLASFTTPPLDI